VRRAQRLAAMECGYRFEPILATQGIQHLATTCPNEGNELLDKADFVLWMGLNDPESPKVLMAILGTNRHNGAFGQAGLRKPMTGSRK
jgi:hypothetical protein